PLPIIATDTGTFALGRSGTLLGVTEHLTSTTSETLLRRGDVALLYTDGLTDLPPPYGIDAAELAGLLGHLREERSADDIADSIHRSFLNRVPDRHRRDDIALLVVKAT